METYCRDETDSIVLSRVSDFEIGEIESGYSGRDALKEPQKSNRLREPTILMPYPVLTA